MGKNTNAKDAKTSLILPVGQAFRLSMRKGGVWRAARDFEFSINLQLVTRNPQLITNYTLLITVFYLLYTKYYILYTN